MYQWGRETPASLLILTHESKQKRFEVRMLHDKTIAARAALERDPAATMHENELLTFGGKLEFLSVRRRVDTGVVGGVLHFIRSGGGAGGSGSDFSSDALKSSIAYFVTATGRYPRRFAFTEANAPIPAVTSTSIEELKATMPPV